MRNEVIKIGALFALLVFSSCVDSSPEEGKKVVIVLPYYKHEVQEIYFKEPSSSAGPPNQEQYSNYLSSKPMGIKVWVEKRPFADRGKTNGFSNNFNSNNGVGFSGIPVQGNRPMNNAWPGSPEYWQGSPGIQQSFSENQPGFSGNEPSRPATQTGFSGNQPPWSGGNQPGFSGNEPPRPGTQTGFSENQTPWSGGNQPGFSGNEPPRPGTQTGFSGNQTPWLGGNQPDFSGNEPPRPGTQSGFSENQTPWLGGNQPGFSGNEPPRSQGTQPDFLGNEKPWSERQPVGPDTNFQVPRYEENSYNKHPNGDVTRPTDSYSSSWSSLKVFPANQGKSVQMSTNLNAPNSRWPAAAAGKNAQGWDAAWKGNRPTQGSNQQPPDNSLQRGKSQWEGQGGRYLPAGDDGWQPILPTGRNDGRPSQGNQAGRPSNGNLVPWAPDTNGRGSDASGGGWETQTQEEWEKNQQGTNGNGYSPPESVTWREERVVLDQQRWPKTTATSPAQGWAGANEVNDGLRGGCPPGVGGNNCNRGVRVRNNHQDGYASEKPADGVIGGWNGPLLNGEGSAVNNYEEIPFRSGKPQEIYLQRENSHGGSGYANKGDQVKNSPNNLKALGFNNYRSRESQGVSSNFAPDDNRSNRNGKFELSEDAEIYLGQDSYGVLINHGNSDFYRNSRNTDVVSGGKFPTVDSYSSSTFGGVKTRVKTAVGDKEKRGNSSAVVVEFGKKLKSGAKKLKKPSVDDLSTS